MSPSSNPGKSGLLMLTGSREMPSPDACCPPGLYNQPKKAEEPARRSRTFSGRMDLIVVLRAGFLLGMTWLANGYIDIPEGPGCANLVPYNELERPSQTFDTPFSDNWNEADLQYLTTFSPSSRIGLNRRKRSRENDRKGNSTEVKIIHIPPSFIPRLGKRSGQDLEDMLYEDRSHEIDMEGNEFSSRLGRGEWPNRIQLNAGNAFTPRLGRAEGPNRIQLNPGSAFTPRLGRSENPNKIMLNGGSAFTPRLGRSDGTNKIILSTGNAFPPRLGRSEGQRITLYPGSAFTPRLG